jgi:hypothetical protein
MRGVLTFTGTDPCDIYAWGGNQDFDSNVPALGNNAPQHIVVTKAPGTGAVQWTVYRNGLQIAQGNSTNLQPWETSGPYFYVGGRHPSATATITGSVSRASVFAKTMQAAEVADRYARAWIDFAPRQIWVPYTAAPSGAPTLSDLKATNITATSVQFTYDYSF